MATISRCTLAHILCPFFFKKKMGKREKQTATTWSTYFRICQYESYMRIFGRVLAFIHVCRNGLYLWQNFTFVVEHFVDMIVMCEFLTFFLETLPSFLCSRGLMPHFVWYLPHFVWYLPLTASHRNTRLIALMMPLSHCNRLQHTATHCNTQRHTATHGNPLQPTSTHGNPRQPTATHCNPLQPTATHYNKLQHTATHIPAAEASAAE